MYDSVEVVELTPEIEGTFTTSDDVVKFKPLPLLVSIVTQLHNYINPLIFMWLR